MIRYLFVMAYLVFVLGGSAANASEVAKSGLSCNLPLASFKYSYMDSAISTIGKPSSATFLKSASNSMDSTRVQFYLWYVYRNPSLFSGFFRRVNANLLVERNDDAVNAILWLILNSDSNQVAMRSVPWPNISAALNKWKMRYNEIDPERAMILELYVDNGHKKFTWRSINHAESDVDLLLEKGMRSEIYGKKLEALFYYTKVAEFGYSKGLIGASLLLPQLGGDACVERASYYAKLSGVLEPAGWVIPTR